MAPAQALIPWTDSEPLECVSIKRENTNTATVCFQAPSGKPFVFRAGQFITLELPVPGGPFYRTYTISSPPTRPFSLTVTVKAQEGSIGTRWMLDYLQPGMMIKAMGPAGQFTTANAPAEKYLFLSAGSGITPMISMTTEMFDLGRKCDVMFVNCARCPSEIIFRDRLENMARRFEGIDIKWVVEEPEPFQPWTGYKGRLDHAMLRLLAPDFREREVFCCGPEPFMGSVQNALNSLGYDMNRYHQESFAAPEETPESLHWRDGEQVELSFEATGVTYIANEHQTLLSAAHAAGIKIPNACGFGACGSCKVKKTSGEVEMKHNGGISEKEIADGYVLACCSYPKGPLALDV